ncbi:hypothetical protein E2C01_078458 [Portunus trituberculatus]|uniref:Uncharacterized protein n=1 Tax=Portunus trituberculatus TaxID=210409 RepID=A0A5B7IIU0_PORTR|nr:hypothetical protein [Portunus trituberculatus]
MQRLSDQTGHTHLPRSYPRSHLPLPTSPEPHPLHFTLTLTLSHSILTHSQLITPVAHPAPLLHLGVDGNNNEYKGEGIGKEQSRRRKELRRKTQGMNYFVSLIYD